MRIIIAGDGETGSHLARTLSVESQDIVLMGTDRAHLASLDAEGNFITFEGSPLSRANQMACGVDGADLFVAVTPSETVNIVACQIAKNCGARRCVARIDSPDFDAEHQLLASTGVDKTIYPERLVAEDIVTFIEHNWVSEWIELHGGHLLVVGARMRREGSLCGRPLKDVPNNPRVFHVAAIRRGDSMILPRGDDVLKEGDTVYFSVLPGNYDSLQEICGTHESRIRRIMITGVGRVTENLLSMLPPRYNITVIDPDRSRCDLIAARFPHVVAVNARANDISTLKDEGIGKCDMLLALTGSSETNIVSCMVAREHGVARTVARIEELQYIPEAESLSIDKIINKKLLNASRILSELLGEDMSVTRCMSLSVTEMAEVVAREKTRIVSGPVAGLSLPREFTVGGIIRGGTGMLVEGRTVIAPGDHVVVFYEPGALNKVSRYFR